MNTAHQIVVSAENNPYMAWQCKLFYFSCVTRMNHQPVVVVHDRGEEWHPDFYELAKAGCAIYSARNYRLDREGNDYAARNQPGSLLRAAELLRDPDMLIVLCDPDMVFVRRVEFPEVLAGEFSSFMDYDRDFVKDVLPHLKIARTTLDEEKHSLCVSVPYIVPCGMARSFGDTWMSIIDLFNPRRWEDVMYAFGLTALKLGQPIAVTHLVDHNYWPEDTLQASMIHYAYGDERWNKRDYSNDERIRVVWDPPDNYPPQTILGELTNQIKEAREFYRSVFV